MHDRTDQRICKHLRPGRPIVTRQVLPPWDGDGRRGRCRPRRTAPWPPPDREDAYHTPRANARSGRSGQCVLGAQLARAPVSCKRRTLLVSFAARQLRVILSGVGAELTRPCARPGKERDQIECARLDRLRGTEGDTTRPVLQAFLSSRDTHPLY